METTIKMLGIVALTIIFQSFTEIDWISYFFGVTVVVYISAINNIFKEK